MQPAMIKTESSASSQPPQSLPKVEDGGAKRDARKASAFWPETHPKTRQAYIDNGHEEQVQQAERFLPEIREATSRGFPIPPAMKERAVYELATVMMYSADDQLRLRAIDTLRKMETLNLQPDALPEQLQPGNAAPAANNVQVNVNVEQPPKGPTVQAASVSATVDELLTEMLGREDVQKAIDARVVLPDEDYAV